MKSHSEVCADFIAWAQESLPGWYVFKNSSGFASAEKVRYGVPTTGGGSDFFAFGPDGETRFYEVKTYSYSRLSPKQAVFMRNMTRQGFGCFVFFEGKNEPISWGKYRKFLTKK